MKRIVKIPVWVEPIEVEIECEGTEDDEMLIDKALVIAEEEHEKVPWEFDRDAFLGSPEYYLHRIEWDEDGQI